MSSKKPKNQFPCRVHRLRIRWAGGKWSILKRMEIASMTLPDSIPLPEGKNLQGAWCEVVDKKGEALYRCSIPNPFDPTVELFEADGQIRREAIQPEEQVFDVLFPDFRDMHELCFFSDVDEQKKRFPEGARLVHRLPMKGGKAQKKD